MLEMNNRYFTKVLLFGMIIITTSLQAQVIPPYLNTDLSIDERVNDLVSRMTLEEKVSQMTHTSRGINRLGIPDYNWWNECLHGEARSTEKVTVFPQPIGLAASFNPEELFKSAEMISDEGRAVYNASVKKGNTLNRYTGLTFWTPNVNIFRDPRWGRGMETYGEDPFLTTKMGLAVVKGLQGDGTQKYDKAHACAKHYAVHSGPEWNRHSYNAENISIRDLRETYLPAFKALVTEGKVKEVMCAYNRFEGKPCCSSDKLLIDILRNSWGYDNIILSDCGAIDDFWRKDKNTPRHETHPDAESASADAVLNGTDLECGGSYRALNKALADGKISEKDLDVSLRRLLKGRFELGMFDPDERVPYSKIPYSVVESPEHIAKALDMNILVYTRTPRADEDGIRYVDLETVLKNSDYVSLHCPLTPQTKHMINKETLALMKPTAFLINTSRGALIDEPALIEALEKHQIAGAGLDVQETEPPKADNPLYTLDNVILTPHMGWKGLETRQRLVSILAGNVKGFLEGTPVNVVS